MSVKLITPRAGQLWEYTLKNSSGDDSKSVACCLIYEKDDKLYCSWHQTFGVTEVSKDMIDGENGWRRVYVPPRPDYTMMPLM